MADPMITGSCTVGRHDECSGRYTRWDSEVVPCQCDHHFGSVVDDAQLSALLDTESRSR